MKPPFLSRRNGFSFAGFGFVVGVAMALCLTIPACAQSSLQIVSPASGAVVSPGSELTLTVNAARTYQAVMIFGNVPLNSIPMLTAPPYRFVIPIPARTGARTYILTAFGVIGPGQGDESAPITIEVAPPDSPRKITVEPEHLVLTYPGDHDSLMARGDFAAGDGIDLTYSSKTRYSSDSPAVATVDSHGRVTAVAPGSGKVTVTYGETSQPIEVIVLTPIKVWPRGVVLHAAQTQQFHATVPRVGDDFAVTWWIAPKGAGTIDSNGLYRAPASIDTEQIVTVTAGVPLLGLSDSVELTLTPQRR